MSVGLSINQGVEIRNAQLELHHFRLRLAIASAFVLALFLVLASRFFYLQVVKHGELHTLAEANRISVVPVVPNRGIIVDRNGVVLAHNYSAYTLEIQPGKSANLEALIDELATVVEIGARDRRRFKRLLEETRSIGSLPVRTRLSDEEIADREAADASALLQQRSEEHTSEIPSLRQPGCRLSA